MGTRSLTVFNNSKGEEIVVMYSHYDGYPTGHGMELARFLATAKYNGIECLAASVVWKFKNGEAFQTYLYPAGTRNIGEEWIYVVSLEPPITSTSSSHIKTIHLQVIDVGDGKTRFSGDPIEFMDQNIAETIEKESLH
jgi:hypothetical protein